MSPTQGDMLRKPLLTRLQHEVMSLVDPRAFACRIKWPNGNLLVQDHEACPQIPGIEAPERHKEDHVLWCLHEFVVGICAMLVVIALGD